MLFKHGVLALLDGEDRHGYDIKAAFQERTGGVWTVNVGQVYATLSRLERDGLVAEVDGASDDRRVYRITDIGRTQLNEWYQSPTGGEAPARDELALKVLLAIAADGIDVSNVIQSQRRATLEQLQGYTRQKAVADPVTDMAWTLLLDVFVLKAEAELRWLDLCEARLRHRDQELAK
jgi:DNA-binding PadR family transcriptional regulator